jgi:hypothetical protein
VSSTRTSAKMTQFGKKKTQKTAGNTERDLTTLSCFALVVTSSRVVPLP